MHNNGNNKNGEQNVNIENIVKRSYEPIAEGINVKDVDGAQMWQGQWWMPLWGCDTLDHLIDDLNAAQKAERTMRNAGPTEWKNAQSDTCGPPILSSVNPKV